MDNRFQTLYRGAPLTAAEMESLFDELFAGTLPPEKLASLLTALIMQSATPPVIAGAARSMRRAALPFPTDRATGDVVGTFGLRSRRAPRARFRARPSCGGSKRRFPMSRARRGLLPSSSGR